MARYAVSCGLLLMLLVPAATLLVAGAEGIPSGPLTVYVEDDISADTTWDASGSPYVLNATVRVMSGATLTIGPGTTVRFGAGAGLMIEGTLDAGSEGADRNFRTDGTVVQGSWAGISFVASSTGRLERSFISGALISISADGPTNVVLKNCTLTADNTSLRSRNGALVTLVNCTLDHSEVSVADAGSRVDTYVLFSGMVVDHRGAPRGGVRLEIFDRTGDMRYSYIVNSTGEVPPVILQGHSYQMGGENWSYSRHRLSMVDEPFTHYVNLTHLVNGTGPDFLSLKFSWPPALSFLPAEASVHEDSVIYIHSEVLDRNGVGHVDMTISSPRVIYDAEYQEFRLFYPNETVLWERVFVNLTDGYDSTVFPMNVTLIPRNDTPVMLVPTTSFYVTEDVPYRLELDLYDEDTPVDDLTVFTDDPDNSSYDRDNRTMVFTYRDGTDAELYLNLTASDGNTSAVRPLHIYFQPVNYPPRFITPLPIVVLDEDEVEMVDLAPYIMDPDSDDELRLESLIEDYSVFSMTMDGFLIGIYPFRDRNGEGYVRLTLFDRSGLYSSEILNVTVLPVNDPPILTTGEMFRDEGYIYGFNVTYNDLDGDMPSEISVVVDGAEYDMDPLEGSMDPKVGITYTARIMLGPGDHSYRFICSDGYENTTLAGRSFEVEVIVNALHISSHSNRVNITLWYLGEGSARAEEMDYDGAIPEMMAYSGCSFRLAFTDIVPVRALVRVWLLDFRTDIVPTLTQVMFRSGEELLDVGLGAYDTSTSVFSFLLTGTPLNGTVVVFTVLDPAFDSDSDGVSNNMDAFPEDPDEWNDTDGDGSGDNADTDDDNDGFADDVETAAGTDPTSPNSFPSDTDGDGVLDHLDADDDDDGIPDYWELENGLDPFDPSDASDDNDGDGRSNLKEYEDGTDPNARMGGDDTWLEKNLLWALVLVIVVLVIVMFLLYIMVRRTKDDEWSGEPAEEEWELQGELSPEEAVDCPKCGQVYPLTFDECPSCGERNFYME